MVSTAMCCDAWLRWQGELLEDQIRIIGSDEPTALIHDVGRPPWLSWSSPMISQSDLRVRLP